MKKILLVFDGANFSKGSLQFIIDLNNKKPLSVTGVFLNPIDYAELWGGPISPISSEAYVLIPTEAEKTNKMVEENMIKFEQACLRNGISFNIHDDTDGPAVEELIKETRFADLLILSSELFYNQFGIQPNEYLKEVIHSSECAVLLIPEAFSFPKQNILCYDGSETSVFAIRQFAYTLPELCDNSTILICVDEKCNELPNEANIEELAVRHFPNLTIYLMKENPRKQFKNWVANQPNPMVVAGAYGRPGISALFKKSFITELIKEHISFIFIAHK